MACQRTRRFNRLTQFDAEGRASRYPAGCCAAASPNRTTIKTPGEYPFCNWNYSVYTHYDSESAQAWALSPRDGTRVRCGLAAGLMVTRRG